MNDFRTCLSLEEALLFYEEDQMYLVINDGRIENIGYED